MLHNFSLQEVLTTFSRSKVGRNDYEEGKFISSSFAVDATTSEKRYTPNFSLDQLDQRLCIVLTSNHNLILSRLLIFDYGL